YFMRHGKATGKEDEATLTDEAKKTMKESEFIENVLRINPEIIYTSPLPRAKETAKIVANIIEEYRNKKIEIKEHAGLGEGNENSTIQFHTEILEQEKGKNILIIGHENNFAPLRKHLFNAEKSLHPLEAIKLPNSPITNELDKRILAELHNLGIQFEQEMNKYFLDTSTKLVL
ncbi:MAG: phosphoglycerate mutase family protein, partial [bacterium]